MEQHADPHELEVSDGLGKPLYPCEDRENVQKSPLTAEFRVVVRKERTEGHRRTDLHDGPKGFRVAGWVENVPKTNAEEDGIQHVPAFVHERGDGSAPIKRLLTTRPKTVGRDGTHRSRSGESHSIHRFEHNQERPIHRLLAHCSTVAVELVAFGGHRR